MYRYQLLIEYVGTDFIGWQIQKKGKTVQKLLQKTLKKILKENIVLVGSGRTDSGVHAKCQSAHFDIKKLIKNKKKIINSLNHFLNKKLVSILDIKKKGDNFHSRYSAKERIYEYIILNRLAPSTIDKDKAWHIRKKLNINIMKKGAKKLIGSNDFSTFRASNCYSKTPIRKLNEIKINKKNEKIILKFKSKSFLRNQVRSMVGCIVLLGKEIWSLNEFEKAFRSKKRSLCAPPAPAEGLYLSKVVY